MQRLSGCIITCYSLADFQSPLKVTAHSTQSQSATEALLEDIPGVEICSAAMWTSVLAFPNHYALAHAARSDATVDNTALSSVLDSLTNLLLPYGVTAWKSPEVEHP